MANNKTAAPRRRVDFPSSDGADSSSTNSVSSATTATPMVVTVSFRDLMSFEDPRRRVPTDDEGNNDGPLLVAGPRSSSSPSSPSSRSSLVEEAVAQAFGSGPSCLGLLAVTDLPPSFDELRHSLLSLAAQLPHLLDDEELAECERPDLHYSLGWSHGKEQLQGPDGRPDTAKGSYYADPFRTDDDDHNNVWPTSVDLQTPFVAMSHFLSQLGLQVAAVCDAYGQSQTGIPWGLYDTLQRSKNAKGRLLHYFARDNAIAPSKEQPNEAEGTAEREEPMWCGWHNDHGTLTGLVPALYFDAATGNPVNPAPFGADDDDDDGSSKISSSGLYVRSRSGAIVRVVLPPHSCAFQIGETAQLQSGGLLRATPHAVQVDASGRVTRESFALFLQPEETEWLALPPGCDHADDAADPPSESVWLGAVPLNLRWKPGHTFGDFHKATLAAYSSSTPASPSSTSSSGAL